MSKQLCKKHQIIWPNIDNYTSSLTKNYNSCRLVKLSIQSLVAGFIAIFIFCLDFFLPRFPAHYLRSPRWNAVNVVAIFHFLCRSAIVSRSKPFPIVMKASSITRKALSRSVSGGSIEKKGKPNPNPSEGELGRKIATHRRFSYRLGVVYPKGTLRRARLRECGKRSRWKDIRRH